MQDIRNSKEIQLFYTRNIIENMAFTSRLKWKLDKMEKSKASIGYKYSFGRSANSYKQLIGEIASDGSVSQCIKIPLTGNMFISIYGEMAHFVTMQQVQALEMPHKFGIQLNVHI